MKTFIHALSYLVAFLFILSVIHYFFKIFPEPELPEGMVSQFSEIFNESGYMTFVKIFELIGAVLLVIPRFRAISLLILFPITINICLFEVLIAKMPGVGIFILLVFLLIGYFERGKFNGLISK